MYFHQVLTYGNAWNDLVEHFSIELEEIRASVGLLTPENIIAAQPLPDLPFQVKLGLNWHRLQGCWSRAIESFGWSQVDYQVQSAAARPIRMGGLGFTKKRVSVRLQKDEHNFNHWFHTLAQIAVRKGFVDIPISIILVRATEEALFSPSGAMSTLFEKTGRTVFEQTKEDLLALSPLSNSNAFLLIGISLEDQGIEVVEIESEGDAITRQVIINRAIEFPPEYHQAGLGILSYFGTVLRQKYPQHNAKVKIEQDGLRVRLVIESENGDREVIEKALREYEKVIRGESSPDAFFDSTAKVLGHKNELRIAQVRIESQKELLAYQGQEVATLRQIIGHSLSSPQEKPICIEVSPTINVTTSHAVQLHKNIPVISEYIQELAALAIMEPDVQLRLLDLDDSLNAIENKQTSDAIKESSGIKKLKKFIDDACEAGTTLNKFLHKLNNGLGLVQKLAREYNDIAAWCGAPQVPNSLLGKESQ
jgi:hypothetical protein